MRDVKAPRALVFLAVPLLCGWAWFAGMQYWAHMVYADFYRTIQDAPHYAFVANFEAYKAFPFAGQFRTQLPITLGTVLAHLGKRAEVTEEAADLAWNIGLTASPYDPTMLIARAEYLINSGRLDEVAYILNRLKTNASLMEEVNLLEAGYAAMTFDPERLRQAVAKRRCNSVLEPQFEQFQIFAETIPCVS